MNTTENKQLSILACQVHVRGIRSSEERDQQLEQMQRKVAHSLDKSHSDLVVLPELCSVEYSRDSFNLLEDLAEPLNGPSFEIWRHIAKTYSTHVVYSFPRKAATGFYIGLAVINPAGEMIGHYDKIYLAQFGASMEKEYFNPGQMLTTFDTGGFRFAPIICADIRIPELTRKLVVEHGVDVILHAGAYFRDPSFYSWHPFAITRALENQIYFLSLNRAGVDFGHSIFCPPWIDSEQPPILFQDTDEEFKRVSIERDKITRARKQYPFLQERLQNTELHALLNRKANED